ncbi:MAG: hypothetical protein PHE96_02680 [Methylococcales bacterium]|nr:hypothetical protein [Methylococcales bacterium]
MKRDNEMRFMTAWIQSTDALLAFDKNQDGIINDGSELFGKKVNGEARETTLGCYTTLANGTKADNGFTALAQYHNNHEADIQLATDLADTKVGLSDIPNFTIDESTKELPQLKGSGLVYNAFILYNTNNEFKALSQVLSTDSGKAVIDMKFKNQHYPKAA